VSDQVPPDAVNEDRPPTESLVGSVKAWLRTQGYPLEMRVAQQLRHLDALVLQSGYYLDPDEPGTRREIDVIGTWSRRENPTRAVTAISLVTECKLSLRRPWVAFTSEDTRIPPSVRVVDQAANEMGLKFLANVSDSRDAQALPLFRTPKRVAHGVAQAFADKGLDVPYQAAMQATKAATARVAEFYDSQIWHVMHIAFPVVVVDGQLLECFLGADGDIVVEPCDEVVLAWPGKLLDSHPSVVHIVTAEAFPRFAQGAQETAEGLTDGAFAHAFWEQ
jgi:hypothetical protein